jgi:hypothetical protein
MKCIGVSGRSKVRRWRLCGSLSTASLGPFPDLGRTAALRQNLPSETMIDFLSSWRRAPDMWTWKKSLDLVAGAFAGGLALTPSNGACLHPAQQKVWVAWSNETPRSLSSPDCRWTLTLRETKGGDERSDVFVRDEQSGRQRRLFDIYRNGIVHWGSDGNSLFVEDFYSADHGRFLLFSPLKAARSKRDGLVMDHAIRSDVTRRLGRGEPIWNYYVSFVSLQNNTLTVAVRVDTTHDESGGPYNEYCFGYEVSPTPFAISKVLTTDEIKRRYGRPCIN